MIFSYSSLPSLLLPDVPQKINPRHAAVALLLDSQQRILMIQRAEHPQDPWSGHMGFPGGGFEAQDASLRVTVERECEEEIGVSLHETAMYMGALTRMNHPRICIDAFVYTMEENQTLYPNEEVAGIYWISLHDLCNSNNRGVIIHPFQGSEQEFPAIHLQEIPVPIWGISLGFIDQLFARWRNQ